MKQIPSPPKAPQLSQISAPAGIQKDISRRQILVAAYCLCPSDWAAETAPVQYLKGLAWVSPEMHFHNGLGSERCQGSP